MEGETPLKKRKHTDLNSSRCVICHEDVLGKEVCFQVALWYQIYTNAAFFYCTHQNLLLHYLSRLFTLVASTKSCC